MGGLGELWASGVVASLRSLVWACLICLPLPPCRIADFQDVLKEPTIALEKLRELSFSGERHCPIFRVFLEQHCGEDGGEGAPRPYLLGSGDQPASWSFSRSCGADQPGTPLSHS